MELIFPFWVVFTDCRFSHSASKKKKNNIFGLSNAIKKPSRAAFIGDDLIATTISAVFSRGANNNLSAIKNRNTLPKIWITSNINGFLSTAITKPKAVKNANMPIPKPWANATHTPAKRPCDNE